MPIEKSAGAVIFKTNKETEYLLLHYPSSAKAPRDYWDFPKGHIEKGEKLEETIKREVKEKTGIKNIKLVENFKETIKYFFRHEGKNVLKFVTFFLAETKIEEVKISQEHIGYKWLSYPEALNFLTFNNAKEILKKANDFLRQAQDKSLSEKSI